MAWQKTVTAAKKLELSAQYASVPVGSPVLGSVTLCSLPITYQHS